LLKNPHYSAEIRSGSELEYDPSFTVMNLGGAGNGSLAYHDLLKVMWQTQFYPVWAVDVREGLAADMQLDLFISMVFHLDAGDEKHLARDHIQ
jgi:hypothetical protein